MHDDADTSTVGTIRDQREMVGAEMHSTVEDVEAAWQEWADRHGFAMRIRQGDRSTNFRREQRIVQAYISGGKWVGDCPNCNGGIACWRENPSGACLDCGTIYRIEFPTKAEEKKAIKVLAERPNPLNRSWHRHKGETVDDLVAENERYLSAEEDEALLGVVGAADVAKILGRRAVEKLKAEGVL